MAGALTSTDLIAAASATLEGAEYSRVDANKHPDAEIPGARLYEDPYSVVLVMVCETWSELESRWTDAQGALVEVMSAHMASTDPKAWDGYLVLLTPGLASREARQSATAIRYDTARVRKLVATGDELKQISDVERTLLPLLPLVAIQSTEGDESVLALLPGLLSREGIEKDAVASIVDAFTAQQPLVESLHNYRMKK